MKILRYSSQFKKDLKKFSNHPRKLEKLLDVLRMLENEENLPKKLNAHKLYGSYKDCLECHIENDFLLIWFDPNEKDIILLRIGSHAELF